MAGPSAAGAPPAGPPDTQRPRRRSLRWALLALAPVVIAAALALRAVLAVPPPPLALPEVSAVVVDRNGELLRAFTVDDGRWRLPVRLDEVDPRFVTLLVAYEDQRFFEHAGVDPRAALRATGQALWAGRIVSGASTLTMQTVRLLTDNRERTALRKLGEAVQAVKLERALAKDEILTRYLHVAPYGGNIEGIRAASLAYFGREPSRLTLAQAALLIALPQSPETRRPDRDPEAAREARDRVLDRLAERGAISPREADIARRESVPTRRRPVPRLAPHLARRLVASSPGAERIKTSLDRDWQASLEALAAERVDHIGPRVSAAILVAEHTTGAIRASVGAARFLDARRAGHVDMTEALRSPGSTLKPFVYGLAIEAGLIARSTLLEDTPASFGGYEPENFDEDYRGTVTAEEALRQSLNVPAITLLEALGPVRLAVRLEDAGATVALPTGYTPTLAIGLGGFGTRLVDLASLYTALANDGEAVPLSPVGERRPARRLLTRRAAHEVAAILQGMRPPRNAPPGLIAYKTGTSYGYRDAWAIGFDDKHVIAVWVGRPDGTPVPQLTGWTDAAPLLFDAFTRIGVTPRPAPAAAVPTAELPPPLRAFTPGRRRGTPGRGPIRIAFPPEGAVVALDTPEGGRAPLIARVIGSPADTWLLDGRPQPVLVNRRRAEIAVDPGEHTLTVVTADGASERVRFRVE